VTVDPGKLTAILASRPGRHSTSSRTSSTKLRTTRGRGTWHHRGPSRRSAATRCTSGTADRISATTPCLPASRYRWPACGV